MNIHKWNISVIDSVSRDIWGLKYAHLESRILFEHLWQFGTGVYVFSTYILG